MDNSLPPGLKEMIHNLKIIYGRNGFHELKCKQGPRSLCYSFFPF